MSYGEDGITPLETMRGHSYPAITQFTIFLENRVGQLMEVLRRFDGTNIRILALSIHDSTECAFARLLLSCLLYTSPSPRDATLSRMPSSA